MIRDIERRIHVSANERTARLKIDWISVVCLILLRNLEQNKKCNHRDIAEEIEERLYRSNMRLCDFGLRKAPGGFWSQDLLGWLWHPPVMCLYTGNPHDGLVLRGEEERKFCSETVHAEYKQNPEELRRVAEALNAGDVLSAAVA